MKIALDTNVLVYAEGVNGGQRQAEAMTLLSRLPGADVIIPLQALEELFNVLTRKHGWAVETARFRIFEWCDTTATAQTSAAGLKAAVDIVLRHKLAFWDAVILAASAEAKCDLLLSEDMQDGFTWGGVTIVNPFVESISPLLIDALRP